MSVLLREAIGDSIRRARTERRRTLRDVSHAARVSLGYLSEIERGRKEPSSELLASICDALAMSLPDLLDDAADTLRPAGSRRRPAVVDPVLRSAVEEALGPVTDGEDAPADDAAAPAEAVSERKEQLDEDIDAILEDIDDVLETNAEDFVKSFIQKGGQ